MAINYTKWPQNIPTTMIARPSKIYPNWYFRLENIPSGNTGAVWIFKLSTTNKGFQARALAIIATQCF
jgi:hypothetical protein